MPENDRRPHIVVSETGAPERFRPVGARYSEAAFHRNRREHGRRLLAELRSVAETVGPQLKEQRAFGVDAGNGIYLEFEAHPGVQLPVDKLESARQGIELLSASERNETVRATVFVPE